VKEPSKLIEPSASPFPGHEYPQRLPLVDRRERGRPAPWSHLHHTDRPTVTLEDVARRLRAYRNVDPGEMAVINDELDQLATAAPGTLRRSAVLVCLFEEAGEVHVVLTRRAAHLRNHRHEVSFPGGRCEADETPVETALREAEEEVNLQSSRLEIVGTLSPLVTMASNSAIWPVVALHQGRPRFQIDPNEVERAFTVSLEHLLAVDSFVEERWWRETVRPVATDGSFPVNFFKVPGDLVWGATARMLTELLVVVTTAP